MTIGEKFQNQGGDRFARKVAGLVECLLLSRLCNTGILFFCDSNVHDQTQFSMGNPNISNSKTYSERKGAKS